jgi:hypothetical protein
MTFAPFLIAWLIIVVLFQACGSLSRCRPVIIGDVCLATSLLPGLRKFDRKYPGSIAQTLMLKPASSWVRVSLIPDTAHFEVQYSPMPAPPSILEIFPITPDL